MPERAGYILITFRVFPEDEQFVSRCEELGVASCGDTAAEALDNIVDATELYLEAVGDEERERVFDQGGVHIMYGTPPPADSSRAVRASPGEFVLPYFMPLRVAVA